MHLNSLADSTITVDVDVTELMGAEIYLYLNSFDRTPKEGMSTGKELDLEATRMIARVSSRSTSRAGDTIKVALDMSRIHFFDKDSERRIGIVTPKKRAAEEEAAEEAPVADAE